MLELLSSGFIPLWLETAGIVEPPPMQPIQMWELLSLNHPDPGVQKLVNDYVSSLSAQGLEAQVQGIWLQTETTFLAHNSGDQPLSGASLTKVATSLAALKTWGAQHRFVTEILVTGFIDQGTVQGDLILQGQGEALFSWPTAIQLGNQLNQLGIQRITGNLVLDGPFTINLEGEPHQGGQLLRQGLNAELWPMDAQIQYDKLPPGTPRPQVQIEGAVTVASPTQPPYRAIAQHQSPPLYQVLQQMNLYSSNEIAEMLAQSLGGATTLVNTAATAADLPATELMLTNGSGLGQANRLSPRAVAGLFQAIQRELHPHQLTIADVFPMSGRDLGTLENRQIPRAAVVKTGTLSTVSALAGVLPTQQHGPVWFTIINRGNDIDGFRQEQDRLLQALRQRWGPAASESPSVSVKGKSP